MNRWFRALGRLWSKQSDDDAAPGPRGEDAAAAHLKKRGYRVLCHNLRTKLGEIDIVAQAPDGRTIVIVEVKSREMNDPDANLPPEVHVNTAKQRKLANLALQYVRDRKLADRPVRFDVIGVDLVAGGAPIIRHHEGAFESPW